MRQNKRVLIIGYIILAVIFIVCIITVFTVEDDTKSQTITIIGKVIIDGWDDDGHIISASLVVKQSEDYLIVRDDIGKKISALDYVNVEVTGIIGKDSYGNNTITVLEYRILD